MSPYKRFSASYHEKTFGSILDNLPRMDRTSVSSAPISRITYNAKNYKPKIHIPKAPSYKPAASYNSSIRRSRVSSHKSVSRRIYSNSRKYAVFTPGSEFESQLYNFIKEKFASKVIETVTDGVKNLSGNVVNAVEVKKCHSKL